MAQASTGEYISRPLTTSNDIALRTQTCLQQLESCLDIPALRKGEWAENRLAEFKFWIGSVGALALSKASLDHRLSVTAKTSEIYATIEQLLQLLHKLLEKSIAFGK